MEIEKIQKYLQKYINDVILPEINHDLESDGEEPISITIYKITIGVHNPNRINFFLDMDPDLSESEYGEIINSDIMSFFKMLSIDKKIHIYWNKRPLF